MKGNEIPASEFEPQLEPAVKPSTWSPMKAAMVEKAQRRRYGAGKSRGWTIAFLVAVVLGCVGAVGLMTTPEHVRSIFFAPLVLGIFLAWIVIAFLPIIVAQERKHPNFSGVQAITIIGLFIPLLWLVAIVWAYSAPDPDA